MTHDTQAFDHLRDSNPRYNRMSPYEIAQFFWNAGFERGEKQGVKLGINSVTRLVRAEEMMTDNERRKSA